MIRCGCWARNWGNCRSSRWGLPKQSEKREGEPIRYGEHAEKQMQPNRVVRGSDHFETDGEKRSLPNLN